MLITLKNIYLRCILLIIIFTLVACNRSEEVTIGKYTVGVVDYGENKKFLQQYANFKKYLGTQLNSFIELEPAYNEVRALQQISSKEWDLVIAPPGLAAIAISRYNYEAFIPLEGREETFSVIVTKQKFPFQKRQDLGGKTIALGQKGSATGYYLPIYNLYGLKFRKVLYAPTPQDILQWLNNGEATVGALSLADYNLYGREPR